MAQQDPGRFPEGGTGEGPASLDERLKAARNAENARTYRPSAKPEKGYAQGAKVLTELVAGIGGGGLVGWVLDRWLKTSPWLLLALGVLGTIVAFRNIYRISSQRPE